MVSIYVTNPASYWEETVGQANEDAQAAIAQKLDIVRNYMESNFGIDLDQLREVLQRRQQDVASGIVDLSEPIRNEMIALLPGAVPKMRIPGMVSI